MRGEAPWAFYVNMTHLYYVKDGLNIARRGFMHMDRHGR